ncbi:hypothetical protein NDU88_005718 [Pleurodeles waltl]|uniref:Uncharacterized protein n=1 Tax=Pleurodeles waltl TaxID=8319 RepID=A0AAV7MXK4_PLEWA|nr:hypothetical protein NDU88_005718 [Pleurodeles waltl]
MLGTTSSCAPLASHGGRWMPWVTTQATLWEFFKTFRHGVCISKRTGILCDIRAQRQHIERNLRDIDSASTAGKDPRLDQHSILLMEFCDLADRELAYMGKNARESRYEEEECLGRTFA